MEIQTVTKPELRARILDHIDIQLSSHGYRGMRVDDLARDVGISKRTLYELFRTKEAMAREALARRFERLEGEIDRLAAPPRDEPDRLRDIVTALFRVHGDPRSILARDLLGAPVLNELVIASRNHGHRMVDVVLREGMTRGRFRADLDVETARRTLLAAVEGLLASDLFGDPQAGLGPAVDAVFEVLVRGLAMSVASRAAAPTFVTQSISA